MERRRIVRRRGQRLDCRRRIIDGHGVRHPRRNRHGGPDANADAHPDDGLPINGTLTDTDVL